MEENRKNVLIISASPKGKRGDNKQYTDYICDEFQHNFEIVYPSVNLKKFKDEDYLLQFLSKIQSADAIIWITPVYVFHLPAQFLKFLNIISETKIKFNKPSLIISTSIHLCENYAESFLVDSLNDLGFRIHKTYSAFLANDLQSLSKCLNLNKIIEDFLLGLIPLPLINQISSSSIVTPVNLTLTPSLSPLKSNPTKRKISLVCDGEASKSFEFAKRILFYLGDIAEVTTHHIDDSINIIPCCGALKCLSEDYCVFDESDDYMKVYESIIKESEAIIFFSDIQNNFISFNLKRFIDRSFRYLHKEQYENKYIGYILSSEKEISKDIFNYLTLFTKFQMGQLIGITSNTSFKTNIDFDKGLYDFSCLLNYLADNEILSPNGYEHEAPWLVYKKNCPRFL